MFQLCCRTCLEQTNFTELRSLFDTYKGFVIRDALLELFQIEVNQTDVLSTICQECLSKVCTVRKIRKELIEHDRMYREMISPAGTKWEHSQLENSSELEPPTSKSLSSVENTTRKDTQIEHNCAATSEQSTSRIEETSVGSDDVPLLYELEDVEAIDDPDTRLLAYELKLVADSPELESNVQYEIKYDYSDSECSATLHSPSEELVIEYDSGGKDNESLEDTKSCTESSVITIQRMKSLEEVNHEDNGLLVEFDQLYCGHCDKTFENEEELKQHNGSCYGTYSVNSETIIQTLDSKLVTEIEPSMKQKQKKREKRAESRNCTKCGKTFRSHSALRLHSKMHSSTENVSNEASSETGDPEEEEKSSIHTCHVCMQTFANDSKLLQHGKLDHQDEFKTYQCYLCSHQFASEITLVKHYETLHKGRRYQCQYCSKWLPTSVALKGHENAHTRKKTYSCSVCGRKFAQYTSMRRHMKIHNEIKSHECDFCQALFRQRSVMLAHRRRHTGEKPYTCGMCEKSFREHSALSKHKRVHSVKM